MSHPAPSTPGDRVDPRPVPEPARNLQHYEILRREDGSAWELGRGTMGITYKAFDVNLCCEVALKVVNAALLDAPNARERFVREARAAAALRHRNVASVYHLGNDGERFFYAMEFVDGETLDALVRRQGPLPADTTLRLVEQVARALAAAERQGLIHRDIKPANIMVVHEDADDHAVVKVIDFGLARPTSGQGTSVGGLTVNGFVGTPQFASPEQLEEHALDARSDIYSLGVTSWFLLTGQAPFAGSLATICQQHLTKPPPWDRLPDGLPKPVRRLLSHMLEKDPAHRPQNAVALRREINDCLDVVSAQPGKTPTAPPAAKPRLPPTDALLRGRYQPVRRVGEGRRGRVYEGRDMQAGGRTVAITFLPAELLPTAADIEALGDEVRLIQAAVHPGLTQVFSYEPAAGGKEGFLVEEWINGGTLVDLLAARGGPLAAGEAFRLLGQAAEAIDHAANRRLEGLDLAVHQVCLHFPADGAIDPREYLSGAMDTWPNWALKIHPLGTIGDHPETRTWAGDVTLVPGVGVTTARGHGNTPPGVLASGYMHALAALAYELLGGAPDARRRTAGSSGKHASLPTLNEEANAVLREVLGGKSPFPRSRAFYDALVRAAGFDPVSLRPALKPPVPVARAQPVVDASRRTVVPGSTGRGPAGSFVEADEEDFPEGSISDRLTLVSGESSPAGRWLFGGVALLAVFVLTVAGVWALLVQRNPGDTARPTPAATDHPAVVPTHEARHPANGTPRPTVPPPLPHVAARPPVPTVSPAPAVVDNPSVPFPPISTRLPDPDGTPTTEQLVSVRVKSIPSGADIYASGKKLGTTPLEVTLPAGTHELSARLDGWPETRETLILGEDQTRATTEIHLMPPGLVPTVETPVPSTPNQRPRHALAAPTRPPTPERRAIPVAPALPVEPAVNEESHTRPEPEVRRALPPLTPFDPDGTLVPHGSPADE